MRLLSTLEYLLSAISGEARTTIFTEGKVYVSGEEWEAVSQKPISSGRRVRVVRTVLEVEKED